VFEERFEEADEAKEQNNEKEVQERHHLNSQKEEEVEEEIVTQDQDDERTNEIIKKSVRFDFDENKKDEKQTHHRRISLIEKLSMEASDKNLSASMRRRKSIARDQLLRTSFPELLENSSSKKRDFVNIFGAQERGSIERNFSSSRRAQNYERNMRKVGQRYIMPLRWQRHPKDSERRDDK
jgi:hypothetical protein